MVNYSVDALTSGYNNVGVGYGALSNVTNSIIEVQNYNLKAQ